MFFSLCIRPLAIPLIGIRTLRQMSIRNYIQILALGYQGSSSLNNHVGKSTNGLIEIQLDFTDDTHIYRTDAVNVKFRNILLLKI